MKEQILNLRKEGKSYNEIKKILNCSKSTISYYCKGDRVDFDFGKELDNSKILEVLELRRNDITYEEITKKIDIPIDKVKKICRKNGLTRIKPTFKIIPTKEEIEQMQKYYDEVHSYRKVSKVFTWSKSTVRKYLKLSKLPKLDTETKRKNLIKRVISWRRKIKLQLVEYKGGKCEMCGYDRCIDALSFHHKNPNEKDFTIGGKSYSFERLKKEVDKCIMVCQNCHIEIHHNLKI